MREEPMPAGKALRVLYELGNESEHNIEKEEFGQELVEILETRMGYEFLAILVFTEPGRALQPFALSRQGQDAAFLETDKAYVRSRCSNPAVGLTHWVARTGKSVCVGNVANSSQYFGIRDGIRSELCAPLLVGQEVIGVINTETTRPGAYTVSDELFLGTAANHIALGVRHNLQSGFGTLPAKRPADHNTVLACPSCKRVQVDPDEWITAEAYLSRFPEVQLGYGVCPSCSEEDVSRDIRRTRTLVACWSCKRVQIDPGHWISPAAYLLQRPEVQLSRGICPHCCEGTRNPGS